MLEGEYAEGRLLVRFREQSETGLASCVISDKFDKWDVRVKHAYHGELTGLYLVEGDFRVRDLLPVVLSDPDVRYAEPDYKIELAYQPNDPFAQSGTTRGDHLDKISAFDAWDQTKGNPSLVIAFSDTGCTVAHEDLADNRWVNTAEASGIPGVDDDGNGYVDDINGWNFDDDNNNISDSWNHGTGTSSAVAGVGDNGTGIAGVAFQCKFAMFKAFMYVASVVEAFQYAVDKKFDIVNASQGTNTFSQALSDAVTELNNNGILLVSAVGNDGRNLAIRPTYPSCLTHDNVISVISTNQSDEVAWFSNWGAQEADLAAPGMDVYVASAGGGYLNQDGTSLSSPLVAGACALLWSKYPSKTHTQIKQLLLDNVDVLSSLSGACVTEGRLNIRKALDSGGSTVPAPEADFAGNPTSGEAALTVSFTDLTSGQVTGWSWDFGDMSASDQQNPAHTYFGAGTYTVSLTVTGPEGSDTEAKTNYITVTEGFNANFVADKTSGIAPLTVQFADRSSGSPTSWSWDFGDGETSAEQNPEHTYGSPGIYTVSLTASNAADNDTETKNSYITVTDIPVPLPENKENGGCSCAVSRDPTPVDHLLGYFVPVILLACAYLALRLKQGAVFTANQHRQQVQEHVEILER